MLIGDLLVLMAVSIFIFIAGYSIHYLKKYTAGETVKLTQPDLNNLKKVYFPSYILFAIALVAVVTTNINDPFAVNSCKGISKCIEAHHIGLWIFKIVLLLTSVIINRVSKKILDLNKFHQSN